jgi:predicted RNA methylase
MKKRELAMVLSQLKTGYYSPGLEQYTLPGDIAAEILITASHFGDIYQKCVADLGCGCGILGIGALLLQAESAIFVDCDCTMLKRARENMAKATKGLKVGKPRFECTTIENVTFTADTVIQNPPFGTKRRGADTQFLKKAAEVAPVVYSLHKKGNSTFLAQQTTHVLTHMKEMRVPLFRSYPFHEKKVVEIEVELLRFEEVNK